jgi:hypothetical protein
MLPTNCFTTLTQPILVAQIQRTIRLSPEQLELTRVEPTTLYTWSAVPAEENILYYHFPRDNTWNEPERIITCRALQMAQGRAYYIIKGDREHDEIIYDDAGRVMPLEALVLTLDNTQLNYIEADLLMEAMNPQITFTTYTFTSR